MPSRPESIDVGPYHYAVRWDRGSVDHERYGTTRHAKQTIAVAPDHAPDNRAVTLLHEVLHCIWTAGGEREGKVTEEEAVQIFAAGLLDTMRRNPHVVAWLMEREAEAL